MKSTYLYDLLYYQQVEIMSLSNTDWYCHYSKKQKRVGGRAKKVLKQLLDLDDHGY